MIDNVVITAYRERICGERGAALMPVILVFASLVVTVGLAFAAISISHGIAVESEYGASRAVHYAEAGLNDALMRLARDRDYLCITTDCYSIELSAGGCSGPTACVWVSIVEGASSTERIITARGRSGVNERILERSFFFDVGMNGKVSGVTWCERDDDNALSPLCPATQATSTEVVENVYALGYTSGGGTIQTGSITRFNVFSTSTGYVVTAFPLSGATGTISIDSSGPAQGFGVLGAASGATEEVGRSSTSSERLQVSFTTPILVATTTYHSLGNTEFARYQLYHSSGVALASLSVQGIAAGGAQARTVVASTTTGLFGRMDFTAPGLSAGDDFLVNTIAYSTGVRYPLNITATASTVGVVSLIKITIPGTVRLSHGTNNLDGTWTLPLASESGYTYTTGPGGSVTVTGLRAVVPTTQSISGSIAVTDSTTGNTVTLPFTVGP